MWSPALAPQTGLQNGQYHTQNDNVVDPFSSALPHGDKAHGIGVAFVCIRKRPIKVEILVEHICDSSMRVKGAATIVR